MAENKILSLNDLKNVTGGTGNNETIGMNCTVCGTFISITPMQLITSNVIECPSCHEKYQIDNTGSAKADEMLRKIQEAQEKIGNL